MAMVATFKVGDKVLVETYNRIKKGVVREVGVKVHFDDDRVFYRVEGEVSALCTAEYLRLDNER